MSGQPVYLPSRRRHEMGLVRPLARKHAWNVDGYLVASLESADTPVLSQARLIVIVGPDDRWWVQVAREGDWRTSLTLAGDAASDPCELLRQLFSAVFGFAA